MATSDPTAFYLFVLFNSVGFSVSLSMIHILTGRFPLQFELQICMVAMYFTYNTALLNILQDHVKLYVVLTTSILSTVTPLVVRFIRLNAKRVKDSIASMVHRFIWILNGRKQYVKSESLCMNVWSLWCSAVPHHVSLVLAWTIFCLYNWW